MLDETKKIKLLNTCVAKAQDLAGLIDYSDDSVVSKTIVDKPAGTLTLFAFDMGQGLSEHTAPYDATVQVVEGSAQITIDDEKVNVAAGQIVIMPANIPHSVSAKEKFKMLLIMIRSKG
jgi:quercetin dioxygenase-like cupin family protein